MPQSFIYLMISIGTMLEWFWVYGIWYFSKYCQYSRCDPLFNEDSFILIILTHFWPRREHLRHIYCLSHSFTSCYQLVQWLEWFWGYCIWYFPRFSIFTLFLTVNNEIFLYFIHSFSLQVTWTVFGRPLWPKSFLYIITPFDIQTLVGIGP